MLISCLYLVVYVFIFLENVTLENAKSIIFAAGNVQTLKEKNVCICDQQKGVTKQIMKKLYKWQKNAANQWWSNGFKGVIQAVTGSGKTTMALAIIAELKKRISDLKVVICVPTTPLLDQWIKFLKEDLQIDSDQIGSYYARSKDLSAPFIVTTHISAGKNSALFKEFAPNAILIVDECHRIASEVHSNILDLPWKARLGMSATVERKDGKHSLIYEGLGGLVFDYMYSDAIKDNVIAPYICYNYGFHLTPTEQEAYDDLSFRMQKLKKNQLFNVDIYGNKSSLGMYSIVYSRINAGENLNTAINELRNYPSFNPYLKQYHMMAAKRFVLLQLAKDRNNTVLKILQNLVPSSKIFVFHQFIPSVEELFQDVPNQHIPAIYHSKMKMKDRIEVLNAFENGPVNLVLSCRALDEGIDVPAADIGIIAGSFSSSRQSIQRAGRVLRFKPDKKAQIYTVYAIGTGEEFKLRAPLYENPEQTITLEFTG